MNINEFKAFIEGFEHSFEDGAPSKDQWEIIKDRLYRLNTPIDYSKTYRDYIHNPVDDYKPMKIMWDSDVVDNSKSQVIGYSDTTLSSPQFLVEKEKSTRVMDKYKAANKT